MLQCQILIATTTIDQEAAIKLGSVHKKPVSLMPLPAATNIAPLANTLMDQPYGWGGLCHYRDCSSMIKV